MKKDNKKQTSRTKPRSAKLSEFSKAITQGIECLKRGNSVDGCRAIKTAIRLCPNAKDMKTLLNSACAEAVTGSAEKAECILVDILTRIGDSRPKATGLPGDGNSTGTATYRAAKQIFYRYFWPIYDELSRGNKSGAEQFRRERIAEMESTIIGHMLNTPTEGTGLYVMQVEEDVTPILHGPYQSFRGRTAKARALRKEDDGNLSDGLYKIDVEITATGGIELSTDTFSGKDCLD